MSAPPWVDPHAGHSTTRVLLFVLWHHDEHGYGPSHRAIGAAVGLRSSSTVHHHLVRLRKYGLVAWEPRRKGTLRPTVRRVA